MIEFTETKYECQFCGYQSTDKNKVEHCEKVHTEINDTVQKTKYAHGKKFPTVLTIGFKDGRHVGRYRLFKVEDIKEST